MKNSKQIIVLKLHFLLLFFFVNSYISYGQELYELSKKENLKVKKLERLGDKYYQTHDKGKGSGFKLYMRNLYWAKRNQDVNGRVISDRKVVEEYEKFKKSSNSPQAKNSKGWQELGPFKWSRTRSWTPGLGRIVSIAIEPKQQQLIYAGSPGGGIWKSSNAGRNWKPLGDDMSNMSIWSIAIDPTDTNTVYLGNSAGQILRSTNGGNTWSEILRVSGTPRRILINSNGNTIFIGSSRALYRSTNKGRNFTNVLSAVIEDIEFKPGNTNVVYACGNNFYKSTNGGGSFSRINSGLNRSERMKMAVTPANPNIVFLVQKRGSSFGYLYRSTNSGASFSTRASSQTLSTNDVYFTQASRDMAITVSDTNANEVHLAGMNYSRSLNGGSSFTTLATWSSPEDRSYVHADVEVLQYINGTIYAGSDGGIFRSRDRGNNMTDLTQGGLAVRQYYRIGNSATDSNMIVGGAQDNGTNIMRGTNRQFVEWLGADGMECFIDHKNKNVVYGTVQFGSLYKSTDGGNSIGNISKPGNFSGEWVTPFMMDPINNNKIYVGYSNLYRSDKGGRSGSWSNITSSINIGGNLDEIAIAKSNNNYIYIAEEGKMWRTKNGQSSNPSWTSVSSFRGDVNFITVDPNNPERVAIATTGSRVYESTNAGSTWKNVKGNLPNIAAQCLVFDDTKENGLYVGMQSGVYYTNDNLSSWVSFSTNLPSVQTTDLEIHYGTRKLRLGTYGRGIWETDLYDSGDTAGEIKSPSNLLASLDQKNVTLTWKDNSNNETGFAIQRNDGSGFKRIDVVTNLTEYMDKELPEGTYTYRVRAYDAAGFSDFSNVVNIEVNEDTGSGINTPSNLVASLKEKNVTLTWKDNSNNETGFAIQRNDGDGFKRINYVNDLTEYVDKNVSDGVYSYRVRAYDAADYSDFSNVIEIKVNTVVTPPNVIEDCDGCVVYDTNSEETGNADHSKEKAADGDPNTYWHSNWYDDNTSHPHFIAIDLGQKKNLVGFTYLGRQSGTTGMVKEYILFGWDGDNWKQLSTGSFQKSTLKQIIDFEEFSTRYIYFRALSEVDDKRWASVAEVTVKYTNTSNQAQPESDQSQPLSNIETPPNVDLEDFNGIKVYPIPFENSLTIKGVSSKKQISQLKLIGNNGIIYPLKTELINNNLVLNVNKIPRGFYVLQFEMNKQIKTIKIFKK